MFASKPIYSPVYVCIFTSPVTIRSADYPENIHMLTLLDLRKYRIIKIPIGVPKAMSTPYPPPEGSLPLGTSPIIPRTPAGKYRNRLNEY